MMMTGEKKPANKKKKVVNHLELLTRRTEGERERDEALLRLHIMPK